MQRSNSMDYKIENEENIQFDSVGEETAEEFEVNVDTIHQAVIWGTDWTTETINMQMVKQNIDLSPDFQRRDAWTTKVKSKFIESLFMGLPIPQIILAEQRDKKGKFIVIDGKQRLLSLKQFALPNKNEDALKLSGLEILSKFRPCLKNKSCTKGQDMSN